MSIKTVNNKHESSYYFTVIWDIKSAQGSGEFRERTNLLKCNLWSSAAVYWNYLATAVVLNKVYILTKVVITQNCKI